MLHSSVLNSRVTSYMSLSSDEELIELIESNNYVHIYGEKDSGKTSRIAKIIEEFGIERDGNGFFSFL